jgi:hypothetical protein
MNPYSAPQPSPGDPSNVSGARAIEPFPRRLEEVAPERQLKEIFGWTPGALSVAGVLATIGVVVALVGGADLEKEWPWLGGSLAATVIGGAWETLRRRNARTVVVHGPHFGVYQRGALVGVFHFSQLTIYNLSLINTVREFFLFGFTALIGVLGTVVYVGAGTFGPATFFAPAFAIAGIAAFVSSIRIRALGRHYYVPHGNDSSLCVFDKAAAARVGFPTA